MKLKIGDRICCKWVHDNYTQHLNVGQVYTVTDRYYHNKYQTYIIEVNNAGPMEVMFTETKISDKINYVYKYFYTIIESRKLKLNEITK